MLPPPCPSAWITAKVAFSPCLVLHQRSSALAADHFTWHLFLFHTYRPHFGLFWHPYINSGQDQCQVNLFWIFIWKCYIIYSQKSSLFFHTVARLSIILKRSIFPCVAQFSIAILCMGMLRRYVWCLEVRIKVQKNAYFRHFHILLRTDSNTTHQSVAVYGNISIRPLT